MTRNKEQENDIPIGMKRQKVCHDDSTPPFSNFCSYCSGSRNCYSEDFRLVPETEQDEIHINTIAENKKISGLKNEAYNQAIDDAIGIVSGYKAIGTDTLFNMNLNVICKRLAELKNKF